jgi:hypothetical protein
VIDRGSGFVYKCCLAIVVDLLVKQVVPLHGKFFLKTFLSPLAMDIAILYGLCAELCHDIRKRSDLGDCRFLTRSSGS